MSIKTKITSSQARKLLCKLDEFNLAFEVTFKPRTEGKPTRVMQCRFRGDRSSVGSTGTGTSNMKDPADYNLFRVYDTEKRDYRNIPLEGLQVIRCAGRTVKVVHKPHEGTVDTFTSFTTPEQQVRQLIATL